MGRERFELRAVASLSRHNSPQDDSDNAAWNKFVAAVNEAANAVDIFIDVMGEGDLPEDQWGDDQ